MRRDGFTLIELLVVLTIISVISVIAFAIFSDAQERGRDYNRKRDLVNLSLALEGYYQRNGRYPCTGDLSSTTFFAGSNYSANGGNWITDSIHCGNIALSTNYISEIPKDPKTPNSTAFLTNSSEFGYGYWAGNPSGTNGCPKMGQYYILFTRLENSGDPDRYAVQLNKDCSGQVFFGTVPDSAHQDIYIITSLPH